MGVNLRGAVLLERGGDMSETQERVARMLKEYNAELELQYIPEQDRGAFDAKPFRVVHNSPRFGTYIVGHFAAKDVNETLIAHVFKHDRKNRNVLTDLEDDERAREAILMRAALDKQEEREDLAHSILKSPKHTYRHNGKKYT
jgi:hypothetical protein